MTANVFFASDKSKGRILQYYAGKKPEIKENEGYLLD